VKGAILETVQRPLALCAGERSNPLHGGGDKHGRKTENNNNRGWEEKIDDRFIIRWRRQGTSTASVPRERGHGAPTVKTQGERGPWKTVKEQETRVEAKTRIQNSFG